MILTYHQIEGQSSSHIYGVTPELLREHVAALGDSAGTGDLAVTFDDAHISNYDLAMPVLAESRVRAILFVPAGFVGFAQK